MPDYTIRHGHTDDLQVIRTIERHAGQRLGQALINAVSEWARQQGISALTLTTFGEVPWNAPYYKTLGFKAIPVTNETAGLRRIREEERKHGLDTWPRLYMRKDL